MRLAFMAFLVSAFSLNASAGIIGMLSEGESTKLELVSVENGLVKVTVTSQYEFPVLHLSRYLGGEGGNMTDVLAALSQGKVPEGPKVADWMAPDSDRASLKVGVFINTEKHSFRSFYTGQQVDLEMATSSRKSVEALADGRKKQAFEFSVSEFAGPNNVENLLRGDLDIALVTQSRAPGAFDSEMKKSIEINLAGKDAGKSCNTVF